MDRQQSAQACFMLFRLFVDRYAYEADPQGNLIISERGQPIKRKARGWQKFTYEELARLGGTNQKDLWLWRYPPNLANPPALLRLVGIATIAEVYGAPIAFEEIRNLCGLYYQAFPVTLSRQRTAEMPAIGPGGTTDPLTLSVTQRHHMRHLLRET